MLIDPSYTTFRISISHYIQLHVGKNRINHTHTPLLSKITKYIELFSFVWNTYVLEKLWLMGGHYENVYMKSCHCFKNDYFFLTSYS